jgi:hypothetical protein
MPSLFGQIDGCGRSSPFQQLAYVVSFSILVSTTILRFICHGERRAPIVRALLALGATPRRRF